MPEDIYSFVLANVYIIKNHTVLLNWQPKRGWQPLWTKSLKIHDNNDPKVAALEVETSAAAELL